MDTETAPTRRSAGIRFRRAAALLATVLVCSPLVSSSPVAAVRTTLTPVADARVEADDEDDNYGSSWTLGVDGSPDKEAYLRFSVPDDIGPVTTATLRLWVDDRSYDGPEVRSTSTAWDEDTITWANRPAPTGPVVADVGEVREDTWVVYDVTSAVGGPGPVAFHLGPDSGDGADFKSRESDDHRPELLIHSSGDDDTDVSSFSAAADTYGEADDPDRNFGSEGRLKVQGGSDPDRSSYLRFAVDGLSGPVQRARLRLYVFNGTGDGPAVHPTTNDWAEDGLTWRNRPGPTGGAVADAAEVEKGFFDLDVTSIVTGPGTYSFVLRSESADSFAARSSEASSGEQPALVVETGPASSTTTSTTTTSTTTTSTTSSTTSTTSSTTTTSTTTTMPPTTTTTTAPPPVDPPEAEPDEPWLGLARMVTHACDPECVESTYSLSIRDVEADDSGDQRSAFRYPPGSSAVLRLEWSRAAAGAGCATPAATTMTVSMREPGGGQIGSAEWEPAIPPTCDGVLERSIDFDTDPFDTDGNDDGYYGVMELHGRLAGGDEDGADTRGAPPAVPGDEPGRYARGHLVSGGVMVGWHEDGDDPDVLAANEAALGEPFGLIRAYEPNWEPPSDKVEDWMAEGKFVLWSVKPPEDIAGRDDWTPVAAGAEDGMIRRQISRLQDWAETHDTQAGYIFNHEPHDETDVPGQVDDCQDSRDSDFPCAGTPDEFIASYGRIRAVIDELGADRVKLIYTATLSAAYDEAPGSDVPGSGDPMTRGTDGASVIDHVDLLGHDSYNWYCFRSRCDWEFPDDFSSWGRGIELAEAQDKQLIIAETASHPGCPDATPSPVFECQNEDPSDLPSPTRDEWVARIGTWLESDPDARRWIVGFAYFHSLHSNDWRFADQTGVTASGREAWRDAFVVDSTLNDDLGGHDYFSQYGFTNL